jgi:hypothetical protein
VNRPSTIIDASDLENVQRLSKLQQYLAGRGLMESDDDGLQKLVAAGCFALRSAPRRPAQAFARIVARRQWEKASVADHRQAAERIAAHEKREGRLQFAERSDRL